MFLFLKGQPIAFIRCSKKFLLLLPRVQKIKFRWKLKVK